MLSFKIVLHYSRHTKDYIVNLFIHYMFILVHELVTCLCYTKKQVPTRSPCCHVDDTCDIRNEVAPPHFIYGHWYTHFYGHWYTHTQITVYGHWYTHTQITLWTLIHPHLWSLIHPHLWTLIHPDNFVDIDTPTPR